MDYIDPKQRSDDNLPDCPAGGKCEGDCEPGCFDALDACTCEMGEMGTVEVLTPGCPVHQPVEFGQAIPEPEYGFVGEHYDAQGDTTFAQELLDRGLLYLANRNLHLYGYALGVVTDDNGKVTNLSIWKTDDPAGIWFDEATEQDGRRKLFPERDL